MRLISNFFSRLSPFSVVDWGRKDLRANSLRNTKVALLLPCLKFGGAERAAISLAHALKAQGNEIEILTMIREGELVAEAEQSFNVVNLQCARTYMLPLFLYRYIKRNNPDTVISSFWKLNICSCFVKLFSPNTKLLLWEHSLPSRSPLSPTWLYAPSASILYRIADRVVCVSTGVSDDISRHTIGLRSKISVIPNPIPPPASFGDIPPVISEVIGKKKIILFVGRLEKIKNPRLFLEAARLIRDRSELCLIIIGDGTLREELEYECREQALTECIRFVGFQRRPYDFMRHANLLVVTSNSEGFGNVIVEAMHCGMRVVSTDCSTAIRDILGDGRYGTIVPLGAKLKLAEAIRTELDSSHSPEMQIGAAKRFLPDIVADSFRKLMV